MVRVDSRPLKYRVVVLLKARARRWGLNVEQAGCIHLMGEWWGQRGSNPRPADYESAALTD